MASVLYGILEMNRVNEKWIKFNNRETLFNQLCLLGLY